MVDIGVDFVTLKARGDAAVAGEAVRVPCAEVGPSASSHLASGALS